MSVHIYDICQQYLSNVQPISPSALGKGRFRLAGNVATGHLLTEDDFVVDTTLLPIQDFEQFGRCQYVPYQE